MNALAELALRFRLPKMAARLDALPFPLPRGRERKSAGDDRWARLAQQGLTPENLDELLVLFSDHPFERGLVAWDGLTASLITSEPLLANLRAAARPVSPLLADKRRGHAVEAPFERVMRAAALRWQGATRQLLDDAMSKQDFGALWLERARLGATERSGLLDYLAELERAHLPTTAQVGARLAFLLGERRAINLWVESMLDLDDERAPATARLGHSTLPRGYVETRRALSSMQLETAEAQLAAVDPTSHEATVLRAELGAKRGVRLVDQEQLAALSLERPRWRYAQRVLVCNRALEGDPLEELVNFIDQFGHDQELWLDLLRLGNPELPWWDELLALLMGQLVAAPHARELWTIVAAIIDSSAEDEATTTELNERFRQQTALQPGA